VNSTAEVKTEVDICSTSGNAEKMQFEINLSAELIEKARIPIFRMLKVSFRLVFHNSRLRRFISAKCL